MNKLSALFYGNIGSIHNKISEQEPSLEGRTVIVRFLKTLLAIQVNLNHLVSKGGIKKKNTKAGAWNKVAQFYLQDSLSSRNS